MKNSIKIILRGVGQVMFQNNALTGLFFLIGIFCNSWIMGAGAILGNIISTFSAKYFGYSKENIEKGIYGFNGTLVGIAIFYFFGFNLVTTLGIIIGAILSTIIMHLMSRNISAFTAPFVISTWIIIYGIIFFNLASIINTPAFSSNLFSGTIMGFGQVMFQASIITGILFFIGIFINSPASAFFALYGSLLGGLFAMLLLLPINMINLGLFGYNAILCAIAFKNKKLNTFYFATIAIILSVLITSAFNKAGIIALTAPFVLATWIVLYFKSILSTQ
jgi:urea transporter